MDVLPIPSYTGSYLRGHASFLRIPLLHYDNNSVLHLIKPHDRLFGWITLTCSDCDRMRWYWLYYENTVGGWYAEAQTEPDSRHVYISVPSIAKQPNMLDEMVAVADRRVIEAKNGIVRYAEQGTFR